MYIALRIRFVLVNFFFIFLTFLVSVLWSLLRGLFLTDLWKLIYRLRNSASRSTTELNAFLLCLKNVWETAAYSKYIILFDFVSSLRSLLDIFTKHPVLQRILLIINILHISRIFIVFIWILSHAGIKGYDLIVQAAKQTTSIITYSQLSPPSETSMAPFLIMSLLQ